MRYFTRSLLDRNQDEIGVPETDEERDSRLKTAGAEWEDASNKYSDYIANVRDIVPPGVAEIMNTGLHDAVILSVLKMGASLVIALNTEAAPFLQDSCTSLQLVFGGVSYVAGLETAVGRALLYEEIYVAGNEFEFSALLDEDSIEVHFRNVAILRSY